MGVSLQIYRVRIGTFNPSVRVKTAKEQTGTTTSQFKWNYKMAASILLLLSSLATFIYFSEEYLLISTSPVWSPSTTACDPSSGPLCTPGIPWSAPLPVILHTYHQVQPLQPSLSYPLTPYTSTMPSASSWTPPSWQSSSPSSSLQLLIKLYPFLLVSNRNRTLPGHFSKPQVTPPVPPWTTPPWPPCTAACTCLHPRLHLKPTYLHLRYPCSWLTAKARNTLMKSTNGNRANRGRGIKMLAWNKGSSYLENKHHEIETIIAAEKPHILGLSEANLKLGTDLSLVQHADYTLHTAPTMQNPQLGISRMVVYTHSSLVVKRRHDLEHDSLSAVWLELGMPR